MPGVLWWVSKFITLILTFFASCFRLFATMSALFYVFMSGFGVWVKHSVDDGARRVHFLYGLSAIVGLLTLLNYLHALVIYTSFLLFLFHSTYQSCSFWTAEGLHIPWWLFHSRDLLFGKEPVPISSQFEVTGKFNGFWWFLFNIVFNIYAIA